MKPEKLTDYLGEFAEALHKQLIADEKRWGDTWRKRPKEGQEDRTAARYQDYWDRFKNGGEPIPWLKVIGGAYICWLREVHPELCQNVNNAGTQRKRNRDRGKPQGD